MIADAAPVIELLGVERVYGHHEVSATVRALAGVDCTITQGQYVCIMGQSGSGKSTMMNVIGCLDRPTAGKYLLEGRDVSSMDDASLSRVRNERIGFVFQSFNLIPELTVLENVEVPLFYRGIHHDDRKKMSEHVLQRVGLADRLDHRPNQLSGGQQQRVAIARSLVGDPAILLADEPTGNLDTSTGDAILALLDELHNEGRTIIMVTHDEDMARRCERVIRLRDGLIESDTATGSSA
ncbi:MAG: ABC transporter ATP-binding protein [Phycisphaerales bacterium]|nr:ABC transporter ATP-binding protein [Phycisphaerales bacterium]